MAHKPRSGAKAGQGRSIGEYKARHMRTEPVGESAYVALCISPRRAVAIRRERQRHNGKGIANAPTATGRGAEARRLCEDAAPPRYVPRLTGDGMRQCNDAHRQPTSRVCLNRA